MKGDNSLRWFRVFQSSHLIKGRGRLKEKVVDDIIFSEYIVFLDISHSLGSLAKNCEDFSE